MCWFCYCSLIILLDFYKTASFEAVFLMLFFLFLHMPQSDKYYFINSDLGKFKTSLSKWNERFYIDVIENYERIQSIDVFLLKFKDKSEKPKTGSYQKVRPVLKELFEDHYNGALRYIAKNNIEDWEYYIIRNSKRWFEVEAFSTNDSSIKGCIKLDLRDSIENVYFSVYASKSLKERPQARKNGAPTTHEHFKQFLNMSLQYLSDHESLLIYYEKFLDNFYKLVSGDEMKVELFDISAEKSFKQIISQLEKRKIIIENRLIDNDQDSKEKRVQLRGELEGIIYSLKTIDIYK